MQLWHGCCKGDLAELQRLRAAGGSPVARSAAQSSVAQVPFPTLQVPGCMRALKQVPCSQCRAAAAAAAAARCCPLHPSPWEDRGSIQQDLHTLQVQGSVRWRVKYSRSHHIGAVITSFARVGSCDSISHTVLDEDCRWHGASGLRSSQVSSRSGYLDVLFPA